jgi:thiamine transport system substrate-binding protein
MTRSPRAAIAAITAVALVTAACGDDAAEPAATVPTVTDGTATATEPAGTVTLVVYDSWPSDDPENPNPLQLAFADFTAETGIEVELLVAGDAGTMLSKAALTAGNPEGDVMWGVDNTLLSRALDAEVFEPYVANGVDTLAPELTALVPKGEATPVDFGDVCVNYDIAALEAEGLAPPASIADLAEPEYASRLVVQNPASSSPGLAFLMATIADLGDGWEQFWTDLRDGGVLVTDGWTEAYYEAFTFAGGDRPLVVSYGSSPPFEVLFASEPLDAAPTGVVEETCFRQIEFAGVLRGTDTPDAARQLVDFLVSERFQREIPLNLFVFPVNPDVELDPVFTEFATIPGDPLTLDPAEIDANRADWIDRWTTIITG